jgi:hypothetical protein
MLRHGGGPALGPTMQPSHPSPGPIGANGNRPGFRHYQLQGMTQPAPADPAEFGELDCKLRSETVNGGLSDQLRSLHSAFSAAVLETPVTMASVIGFINDCLEASRDDALKYPSLP